MVFIPQKCKINPCKTLSKLTWLNYVFGWKVQQNISRLQFPNKEKPGLSTKFIANNSIMLWRIWTSYEPILLFSFYLIGFWDVLVINYFAPVENDCFVSIRPGTSVYSFSLPHLLASFSCHTIIQTLVTCWRSTCLHKSTHLVSVQFCTVCPTSML